MRGQFFPDLKLVDFGLEYIFLISKLFFLTIPHQPNPLKLMLLFFEDQLPLLSFGVMIGLDLLEGLFEQGDLLLSQLLHLQAAGDELRVVGLLQGEEFGCELLELVLQVVRVGERLGF